MEELDRASGDMSDNPWFLAILGVLPAAPYAVLD